MKKTMITQWLNQQSKLALPVRSSEAMPRTASVRRQQRGALYSYTSIGKIASTLVIRKGMYRGWSYGGLV